MWYVIRSWHVLPSGNVCATVVDEHGELVRVSLPRNRTSDDEADRIIRHVLATRPARRRPA